MLLTTCFRLALTLTLAGMPGRLAANDPPGQSSGTVTTTNGPRWKPGPLDGPVAAVTAKLLERQHYSRQHFDDAVSARFLKRYLNDLDPQHMHFLQTDIAAFELYSDKLDDLILKHGDTWPAYEIFERFVERLEQRVAHAAEVLKTETFQFTNDERVALNRRDLPHPKDLEEAQQLWRERLRYEYLQEKLNKEKPEKIVETITRRNSRTLRAFKDWESDDILQVYLTSLAHVYDPHSDYFNKSQAENFSIGMNLQLFGIGAELTSEDGYCKIRKLLPGPAEKSKRVKVNDRIIAVAQSNQPPVDIVDMPLTRAVSLIRGQKGTEVRLTIIPADAADPSVREIVSLVRDEIKLEDQEAKAKIIEWPGPNAEPLRVGVIDLPSFYATIDLTGGKRIELAAAGGQSAPRSTSADVARLLTKLKQEKVSGVILDLRRNGGGSLEEAIKLTGLFIKEGPVVQERDADGAVRVDEDKDAAIAYDGPLIVLTSRGSASASEIVAGALQDYGRALLVGDSSTHGKGTVQGLNPLQNFLRPTSGTLTNDPGALKLTVRKFYRASGSSTQLKGITPDIILPSVNNVMEVGEAFLENPLPWDTIESAKFERLNRVEPCLAELRKRSTDRVAAEPEFAYAREDMDLFKKALADKSVSLSEKQRLKEKDEADARQKARDKERLARKSPEPIVYNLTLKQVDLPGLPAPEVKTNVLAAQDAKTPARQSDELKNRLAVAENDRAALKKEIERLNAEKVEQERRLKEDTGKKLAAAEREKTLKERELKQLMADKAGLERRLGDPNLSRTQTARSRSELSMARRREWNERGLSAAGEERGASRLLFNVAGAGANADRARRMANRGELTNALARVAGALARTEAAFTQAADALQQAKELAAADQARIAQLESSKQALSLRSAELETAVADLAAKLRAAADSPVPAAPQPGAPGAEDEAAKEKPAPVDFALQESEHILVDYLGLLEKNKVLTASTAEPPPKKQ